MLQSGMEVNHLIALDIALMQRIMIQAIYIIITRVISSIKSITSSKASHYLNTTPNFLTILRRFDCKLVTCLQSTDSMNHEDYRKQKRVQQKMIMSSRNC